jgi:hypothetical protein
LLLFHVSQLVDRHRKVWPGVAAFDDVTSTTPYF